MLLLLITACTNNELHEISQTPLQQEPQHEPLQEPQQEPPQEPPQEPQQESQQEQEFVKLINAGKINSSEIGIGDSTDELIQIKGQANEIDYLWGGLYFSYDNILYLTDAAYDDDKNILNGRILIIVLGMGEEIYGLKLGSSSIDAAISIFGSGYLLNSPDDNTENFLLSDRWSYEFEFENNNLIFTTDSEGGIIKEAYLWANK